MNSAVWEPLVVSVDDAMKASNLGRTFIYQLINEAKIDSIKRGKRRLIVYASLKTFLTSQTPAR
jgi:excisionase family DNA binding protein